MNINICKLLKIILPSVFDRYLDFVIIILSNSTIIILSNSTILVLRYYNKIKLNSNLKILIKSKIF